QADPGGGHVPRNGQSRAGAQNGTGVSEVPGRFSGAPGTTLPHIDSEPQTPLKAACSRADFGPRSVSRPVVLSLKALRIGPVGAGLWPITQEGALPQTMQPKRTR